MAACVCGAPIRWGETQEGERVPLSAIGSYGGDGRYRVVNFDREPWLIEPVKAATSVAAYEDHRRTCPRA